MTSTIHYDVVLVGGSPSNLALAHRLLDLAAKQPETAFSIAVLEKSKEFGGHICSGAVVEPRVINELFPNAIEEGFPLEGVCEYSEFDVLGYEQKWAVPNLILPAGLRKEGYWILSLSLVVGWMATRLKERAKSMAHVTVDLYPGFSAHETLYEGKRVVGVSVVENLEESPNPQENSLYGKVVVYGDKGFLSGDLVKRFDLRPNPQLWSVGVKEVWQLPETAPNYEGKVWHTLGYPLLEGDFGGGFIYGLKNRRLAVGLIVSLDSPNPNLNPQQLLQAYKKHPMLQNMLAGATLQKYGAALLPEGGYYSLPTAFAVDGALLVGDALGVLDVNSLNGVANSMETGMLAAQVIHNQLLGGGDFSAESLKPYKHKVMTSYVGKSLKDGRYFRSIWQENRRLLGEYLPDVVSGVDKKNPIAGFLKVGLSRNPLVPIMDAARMGMKIEAFWDLGPVKSKADFTHLDPEFKHKANGKHSFTVAKDTIYSREDAVFYAAPRYHHDNKHIDEFNADVCVTCILLYQKNNMDAPCVSDCTAEVHRIDVVGENGSSKKLHAMSLENCIQCRTCEIICPEQNLKVRPTAQAAGPDFAGL